MEKKKWYATMAAVLLLAATGCSDDFENGNNSGTNEEEGNKAYMTVNISTVSDGPMTKAANDKGAGWGEDGNDFLGELAGKKEAMVYDINVFLVETEATTLTAQTHLSLLNTEAPSDILTEDFAGHGYYNLGDAGFDASTGGDEPNHGSRNVTITMKKDLGTTAQPFQVFTIVNAGEDLKTIKNLSALRDYIQKGGENAVIKTSEGNVENADKFVMSTHKMYGEKGLPSIVSLSSLNTAENPAQTSVYVERLAARIDLSYPAATTDNGNAVPAGTLPNKNDKSPVYNKGTFQLTGYMVVNQWMGGTNMFKQVSPTVEDYTASLSANATYEETDPVKYLGDEKWAWTISNQPAGSYNFVLSQKFDDKTIEKINTDGSWSAAVTTGDDQAYYKNYFSADLNNKKNVNDLPTTGSYTEEGANAKTFYPIAYVRENTMNTNAQVNGYTTGVIFRTQFTPADDFTLMAYTDGAIKEETLEKGDDGSFQFLTAEHFTGKEVEKLVYKDVKSVAAKAFKLTNGDQTNVLKGLMENKWDDVTATLDGIKGVVNDMSEKNQLSKSFKTYLNGKLATATDLEAEGLKASLTYDAFVEAETNPIGKALLKKTDLTKYDATDIANLAQIYGIDFFRNGQSYHKFWIRHDDNMDDNKMGVMEFAIVRNNVYQLNVTGVRGLGDPLPFTPGKDDPKNPDESNKVTINVTIYVKDWVKRTNKDIIL